jgi:hypothetical protein
MGIMAGQTAIHGHGAMHELQVTWNVGVTRLAESLLRRLKELAAVTRVAVGTSVLAIGPVGKDRPAARQDVRRASLFRLHAGTGPSLGAPGLARLGYPVEEETQHPIPCGLRAGRQQGERPRQAYQDDHRAPLRQETALGVVSLLCRGWYYCSSWPVGSILSIGTGLSSGAKPSSRGILSRVVYSDSEST